METDNHLEKNPTSVGHPILTMDPSPPQPTSLLEISEDCVDILEAILKHHTKDTGNKICKSL